MYLFFLLFYYILRKKKKMKEIIQKYNYNYFCSPFFSFTKKKKEKLISKYL